VGVCWEGKFALGEKKKRVRFGGNMLHGGGKRGVKNTWEQVKKGKGTTSILCKLLEGS